MSASFSGCSYLVLPINFDVWDKPRDAPILLIIHLTKWKPVLKYVWKLNTQWKSAWIPMVKMIEPIESYWILCSNARINWERRGSCHGQSADVCSCFRQHDPSRSWSSSLLGAKAIMARIYLSLSTLILITNILNHPSNKFRSQNSQPYKKNGLIPKVSIA